MKRHPISWVALGTNLIAGIAVFGNLIVSALNASQTMDPYNFWGALFTVIVFSPWVISLLIAFLLQLAGLLYGKWRLTLAAAVLYVLSASMAYMVWYLFLPSVLIVLASAIIERKNRSFGG